VLFSVVAAVVALAGYASFLNVLNYYTQPWYYVTVVAFLACALEVMFGAWGRSALARVDVGMRGVRIFVAVALLGLGSAAAWDQLTVRHTNIDIIAARLQPITAKGDVILVPRWECAIPFARYYRGPAEMVSLPPIADHRFHRYDLVLEQMLTRNAAAPVIARIESALRAGHRVFVVGTLPYPKADVPPPMLPPMYQDPNGGWRGAPRDAEWTFQIGQFLRAHCLAAGDLPLGMPAGSRIQDYEDLELSAHEGWR
jgi:hypothetical protein